MASVIEMLICIILLAIIMLLVVPAIIHYTYLYYKHSANPIISKRHHKNVIVFNILLIISLIGDKGLYMISIIITETIDEAHAHLLYVISDYVYFFAGPSIVLTMFLRAWKLYYDINWAKITNPNKRWKHFIDGKNESLSNNWFIKYQSTIGNDIWFAKYIVAPSCLLVFIILIISLIISPTLHYFLFIGINIIFSAYGGVIYCLIPKKQIEIFKVKFEVGLLYALMLSWFSFFIVYVFLRTVITGAKFEIILPFQYVFTAHYFIWCMITTRWVLVDSGLLKSTDPTRLLSLYINKSDTALTYTNSNEQQSKSKNIWSIHKILRNELSFQVFMCHLLKEFSAESLLAIFEFWQFKIMINSLYKINDNSTQIMYASLKLNERLNDIQLPETDDMPKSVIVYNDNLCIKDKIYKLNEKYIQYNGNFTVNISSGCRQNIVYKLSELKEKQFSLQEYYNLFDQVLVELMELIKDSYNRFLLSNDYNQLILNDLE